MFMNAIQEVVVVCMDIENRALDVVNSVVKSTDFTRTQNFFD